MPGGGPPIIEVDPATGQLGHCDLHARLVATGGPEPVAVPLTVESVTIEPPDLLHLETLPPEPDGITVYRAWLAPSARQAPDLVERLERPVNVTITGRPADDPRAEPVTRSIPVQVRLPSPTIHWRRADRPAEVDLPLEIEAEAGAELTLEVWVDRYDVTTDRTVSDAGVEFTHMANEGRPSPLTIREFRPHPDDLPWNNPASATRDRSRWQVVRDLPDPERPDLVPPVETAIRVRAWTKGSIAQRSGNQVTLAANARQLAEAVVPVVLGPVRLDVEVVEPEMPVPADGRPHEVVLQLTRRRDGKPATRASLAWAPRPGAHPTPGTFEPGEGELTGTDNGMLRLRWTTPELRYRPGDSYTVPLVVEQGPAARRTPVGSVDLHLNPELSAELRIAKPGLEWEPTQILLDAGSTPATLLGDLVLPVDNVIPADRSSTRPPVADADAELWVIEGGRQMRVGEKVTTADDGEMVLVLPGLEHTFSRPGPERRTRRLDPDRDITPGRFHPDEVAPRIDHYDDRLLRFAPLPVLGPTLEQPLRSHRLTLADQLAGRPRADAALAVSGVQLVGTAACYVHSYQQAYEQQWLTVKDDMAGVFSELVNVLISASNIGQRIGDAATETAHRLITTLGPRVSALLARMSASLGPRLAQLQAWLVQQRDRILPFAQKAYELAVEAFEAAAQQLGIARGAGPLLARLTAVLRALGRGLVAVVQSLWCIVTTGLRELVGQLADWVVAPLHQLLQQAPEGVRELLHLVGGAIDSTGVTWSLAKTVEAYLNDFFTWLGSAPWAGGLSAEAIRARFDPFPAAARKGLEYTLRHVESLDCSTNPDLNLDWALRAATDVRHQAWSQVMDRVAISWWLDAIDLAVFALEAAILFGATIASGGGGAAFAPALFTQIEVGVGVIKTLVARIPLTWSGVSFATAIAHYTSVNTASLGVRL